MKKLQFTKETIASLDNSDLSNINGGIGITRIVCVHSKPDYFSCNPIDCKTLQC
ncbi:MAG: class I lanthipeptide [Hyphomicrobiales bacterium]